MTSELFEDLQQTLEATGPGAAIDKLCASLRDRKDYANLFYALLLKKRHELGVSPIPTGPSQDLPDAVHGPYEEAIRDAGRLVGNLYLEEGNIAQAWMYYRMLGEPETIAKALDQLKPAEGEDVQQLVDIGYHQGVNPKRGFDLILQRFGICSAITMVHGHEFPHGQDVREYCIRRLVGALYHELAERLKADIIRREGSAPNTQSVGELIAGRDYLFEDEFYHIDVSHLGSVTQMSMHLPPGDELNKARELCEYGQRLSPRFIYPGEPPFENQYKDYAVYLATLAGDNVDEGINYFKHKVENANPEEVGTFPAEVLVNLLLRVNRPQDALVVARKHLAHVDSRQITCPSVNELCHRTQDFHTLAEVAREQNDPVHFVAGLMAAEKTSR